MRSVAWLGWWSWVCIAAVGAGCSDPAGGGDDGDDDAAGGTSPNGGGAGTSGTAAGGTAGAAGMAPGGASGTGGAAAGGTAGTAGGTNGPACRTYATAYTFSSSLGASYRYTCSHSESASGFERSCVVSSSTFVERWANRAAFIDEAAAVGIRTLQTSGTAGYITSYEYDAQGRPLRTSFSGEVQATYDSWDDRGRPLHMIWGPTCGSGTPETLSYDDTTRTFTRITATGSCAGTTQLTHDANMIPTTGVTQGATVTYTTTATATVCR